MEKRGRNIGVLALLGAVFALLLVFNLLTPLTADDFLFCFSRAHWSRITGAAEIFPSLAALRREANGRVIPHFFFPSIRTTDMCLVGDLKSDENTLSNSCRISSCSPKKSQSKFWAALMSSRRRLQ